MQRRKLPIILITLVGLSVFLLLVRVSPKEPILSKYSFSQAYYGSNGELLRLTLAKDGIFRLYTPISEISPSLIKSTMMYEDNYYYFHPGVNPSALFRAVWSTYIKKDRRIGASTISMQLARIHYNIDTKNISGKLSQMGHALWLEMNYSKKEILEAYLNLTPYGHNIEGASAASLIYFNKRSKDLTLLESMTLSVIPQNPNKRLPTKPEGEIELKTARAILLNKWLKKYPNDEFKLAHFDLPLDVKKISELPFLAPHFIDSLLTANIKANEIYTTIDLDHQRILENEIKAFVNTYKTVGINNAAALLINRKSNEVVASVGSADFFDNSIAGQNDGTQALRSPGSTLKPFIYALAIEQGVIHQKTLLKDSPRRFGLYSPENSDFGYMGPISAQKALVASRNIPAVDLLLLLQKGSFYNILQTVGVKNLKSEEYYGAALALGGFEISMEDVARLYSALGNEGKLYKLVKEKNKINWEKPTTILTPEASFLTVDMLQYGAHPYSKLVNFPIYWKTGTSYAFKDGWTAGIFGDYVLVTWVGNFNGEGNHAFMSFQSAAPLFFDIAHEIIQNSDETPTKIMPSNKTNVKVVDICGTTGELLTGYCPNPTTGWFIPGVSPIKTSDIFRQIPIDIKTGLRACTMNSNTTRLEYYEFWPSDILNLFKTAGIQRKTPPPFMPDCTLEDTAYQGDAPKIVSPQGDIVYKLVSDNSDVPLQAITSSDASKVYWFLDEQFLGQSPSGETFFWNIPAGRYKVRAVDNLGRATSSPFIVEMAH